MTTKVIDLPVERIKALKDEALARAKAAGMNDEALNGRYFALMDVLIIKEQRVRRGAR